MKAYVYFDVYFIFCCWYVVAFPFSIIIMIIIIIINRRRMRLVTPAILICISQHKTRGIVGGGHKKKLFLLYLFMFSCMYFAVLVSSSFLCFMYQIWFKYNLTQYFKTILKRFISDLQFVFADIHFFFSPAPNTRLTGRKKMSKIYLWVSPTPEN